MAFFFLEVCVFFDSDSNFDLAKIQRDSLPSFFLEGESQKKTFCLLSFFISLCKMDLSLMLPFSFKSKIIFKKKKNTYFYNLRNLKCRGVHSGRKSNFGDKNEFCQKCHFFQFWCNLRPFWIFWDNLRSFCVI